MCVTAYTGNHTGNHKQICCRCMCMSRCKCRCYCQKSWDQGKLHCNCRKALQTHMQTIIQSQVWVNLASEYVHALKLTNNLNSYILNMLLDTKYASLHNLLLYVATNKTVSFAGLNSANIMASSMQKSRQPLSLWTHQTHRLFAHYQFFKYERLTERYSLGAALRPRPRALCALWTTPIADEQQDKGQTLNDRLLANVRTLHLSEQRLYAW